jgi:hypothetical protein
LSLTAQKWITVLTVLLSGLSTENVALGELVLALLLRGNSDTAHDEAVHEAVPSMDDAST